MATIVLVLLAAAFAIHFAAGAAPDLESSARIVKIGWLITAAIVVFQIITLLIAASRLRSTIYTLTNQRVMIETGLLSKKLSEIDLRYVDDTQFSQRFVDRMLGVGDITLISSDKAAPFYVLRGIADPRALRETIRSHAYRVSQRQIFTRAT
ncbi:MAG: PH domain-containing protein [Acidobacteriota bacterium]